ncbi:hypothetical protein M153_798000516 [Pseudoloma neurophilia]|uniref:Uncharacterized protein n=1 Tax=Pseudoloma neurophilia TaxID=146866 RepID=A0A0R0LVZ3_9MICR|nr:hypothetical protein M153_798000516 [Pseudoloma neurophilia]
MKIQPLFITEKKIWTGFKNFNRIRKKLFSPSVNLQITYCQLSKSS